LNIISHLSARLNLFVILAAATPNDMQDLRLILECGSGDIIKPICCRIALERVRDAHLQGDFETERILGNYLKRHCPRPSITPR
jgi:hypothetical protein